MLAHALLTPLAESGAPGDFGLALLEASRGFRRPDVPDTERLDAYRRRVDLGVWSPVDALMADNPDVRDRDEALATLQGRLDESAVLGREPVRPLAQGV